MFLLSYQFLLLVINARTMIVSSIFRTNFCICPFKCGPAMPRQLLDCSYLLHSSYQLGFLSGFFDLFLQADTNRTLEISRTHLEKDSSTNPLYTWLHPCPQLMSLWLTVSKNAILSIHRAQLYVFSLLSSSAYWWHCNGSNRW